jgi:hypothetical protein
MEPPGTLHKSRFELPQSVGGVLDAGPQEFTDASGIVQATYNEVQTYSPC